MCRVGILGNVWLDAQSFYETPHKWWQTSHLACLTTLSLRPLGDTSKNLTFVYRITWSLQAQTLLRVLHRLYHQNSREWYFYQGPRMERRNIRQTTWTQDNRKTKAWIAVVESGHNIPRNHTTTLVPIFLHSQQYSKRKKKKKKHKPINSYQLVYSFHCWGSLFERLLL